MKLFLTGILNRGLIAKSLFRRVKRPKGEVKFYLLSQPLKDEALSLLIIISSRLSG